MTCRTCGVINYYNGRRSSKELRLFSLKVIKLIYSHCPGRMFRALFIKKMADIGEIVDNIVGTQNYLDAAYGANRAVNGLTFGGVDYLGDKLGFDSQMNEYLELLSPEERMLRQGLGNAAEWGGSIIGLNAGLRGINSAWTGFNRWNGRRNLVNQLKKGTDFEDINFGKIDPAKLKELNQLRKGLRQPSIKSERITIPSDRVEHIYQRRVLDNRYSPEDAADTIYRALFGKDSRIRPDKEYDTLQHFIDSTVKPENTAIVGKIRGGDNIFVKTGFKK